MSYRNLVILGLIVAFYLVVKVWPDRNLRVVFCDVGQGDSAVIVLGKFQALIDTGPDIHKLNKCLLSNIPFWDRSIELVITSHPQKDHDGALNELKKEYRVLNVKTGMKKNDVVKYGMLHFDILSGVEPEELGEVKTGSDENEDSVVVGLGYGKFYALFTADIGFETELAMIDMGVLKNVDVLKVAHHGSKYSTGNEFLNSVKPKIAVISVGAKNSYGHPSGDTLMRLDMFKSKVLRTDLFGSVTIKTDGEKIDVYKEH